MYAFWPLTDAYISEQNEKKSDKDICFYVATCILAVNIKKVPFIRP